MIRTFSRAPGVGAPPGVRRGTLAGGGLNRRDLMLAAAAGLVGGRATAEDVRHRVDVHLHLLPPQYLAQAPASARVQAPWGRSPEATLEAMDRNGVAVGMLSFPTPFYWFAGIDPGRRLARLCNDHFASLVQRHPGRFGLLAALPPLEDTAGVLAEIAYAYDALGADGVAVMSNYSGRYLGDEAFAPVWDELDRRRAVVFVHPSEAPCCTAINDGVGVGYGEFPFDTARTVMSLWSRDALASRPNLRFVFSHGGGALPMIADRIDKFGRPGANGEPPIRDALSFIQKLYFDTANAAGPAALPAILGMANHSHVLFGSDFPYIPIERNLANLERSSLSGPELAAIEAGNAMALFPRLRPHLTGAAPSGARR